MISWILHQPSQPYEKRPFEHQVQRHGSELVHTLILPVITDEPNRHELFQTAIQEFVGHSSTLTQTARLAANGTSCRSKSTIESINMTASQVCWMRSAVDKNRERHVCLSSID
jgi:hypothetical protein